MRGSLEVGGFRDEWGALQVEDACFVAARWWGFCVQVEPGKFLHHSGLLAGQWSFREVGRDGKRP